MSVELKTYLGDSVYAEYQPVDGSIKLTTENGLPGDPSNEIVLDIRMLDCLELFCKRIIYVEAQATAEAFERDEDLRAHAQREAIINRFLEHRGPGER